MGTTDFFPPQPKSAVALELFDLPSDKAPKLCVTGNLIKQNKYDIRIY